MTIEEFRAEVLATRIDELEISKTTLNFIIRRLGVSTIADFLEKVKCFASLKHIIHNYSDALRIEKFLHVLDIRNIRLADCPKDTYPQIEVYISERIPECIDIVPFECSDEFVDFLKDKGCKSMADVLALTSNDFVLLKGDLRTSAIRYLRSMDEVRGWRLSDAPITTYPDIDVFIGERFWIFLSELPFSTRIKNSFDKHEIDTTSQLLQYSRDDLLTQKIVGEGALKEIVDVLHQNHLHLKGDVFSSCKKCYKGIVKRADDDQVQYCSQCNEKIKRIAKMNDIVVTLSGPEYGRYTSLSSGFTLYANVENRTDEMIQIELVDFYVFSAGRQRAAEGFQTGYSFSTEFIFANTAKTAGKIFSTQNLKDKKLVEGDYVIITIKTKANTRIMYKFTFTNCVLNTWEIEDYCEIQQ